MKNTKGFNNFLVHISYSVDRIEMDQKWIKVEEFQIYLRYYVNQCSGEDKTNEFFWSSK